MFKQLLEKQEQIHNYDFTKAFVHLLNSASEIYWESCKSFCNVIHENRAEKKNVFFPSSVRTDATLNVIKSWDHKLWLKSLSNM